MPFREKRCFDPEEDEVRELVTALLRTERDPQQKQEFADFDTKSLMELNVDQASVDAEVKRLFEELGNRMVRIIEINTKHSHYLRESWIEAFIPHKLWYSRKLRGAFKPDPRRDVLCEILLPFVSFTHANIRHFGFIWDTGCVILSEAPMNPHLACWGPIFTPKVHEDERMGILKQVLSDTEVLRKSTPGRHVRKGSRQTLVHRLREGSCWLNGVDNGGHRT